MTVGTVPSAHSTRAFPLKTARDAWLHNGDARYVGDTKEQQI